jgi:predicted ATPase/class 3 adenylate cyclase
MSSNPRIATFLFTDLENSTPLWENHPELMQQLAARHDALLREVIEAHRGQVVKTTGDGFHAVFETASDGVAAALAGQQAMIEESWPAELGPLQVRMGLHTGESQEREGDYYGSEVNRAARVVAIARGGEILLSQATVVLVSPDTLQEVDFVDMGQHRLRGLAGVEQLFRLSHPDLPEDFPPLESLSAFKHNLPVQRSTFIGREKELARIQALLVANRLLTLLGPGGTGKTRLMLELAESVLPQFADGVWLVELAPLSDPDLVAVRCATALNVQEQPGRAILDSLVDYLRHKELLLLLDNVEHLVRECAKVADHLLAHCPKLKLLVTGREALFIDGETTLQIPSLSLAERNGAAGLESVKASEAVQLFVNRAQAVQPDFELNEANAGTVATIVRRLDGIPLALELAAARTRMLTVEQIGERLDDRFRLLTGGRRTALPRQQALQALIDWSWNLLDDRERLLLQRLSVFSGGWSLDVAQTVACFEPLDANEVFDLLEQLVNKSLVTVDKMDGDEARYGMLESIRQYCRDRLFESGEGKILRDRHADFFVAFAQEAGPHMIASTMLSWVERIRLELDNIRSVIAWTLEDRPDLALRLAGSLLYVEAYWLSPAEARGWLEPAIERARALREQDETAVPAVDLIKGLIGLGQAYGLHGYYRRASRYLEEAIDLARHHGELRYLVMAIGTKHIGNLSDFTAETVPELEEAIAISRDIGFDLGFAWASGVYGLVHLMQGRSEMAIPYYEESVKSMQRVDNPRMNASMFAGRAQIAYLRGDVGGARQLLLTGIENSAALRDWRTVNSYRSNLAHLLRREGDVDEAERYYRETIVAYQEMGQMPAVCHQLECFAYVAIARGGYERAARLLGAAGRAREELNAFSTDAQEIEEYDRAMSQLEEVMGEEERDRAMAEGSLINLDDAVQIAVE